jgi:ferredoxin
MRASAAEAHPEAIRPPGALAEDAFLARCIRCGACVNACPTSALQPSFTVAGLEGLYTPVLVARRGWCEPSCTRCGQVCPTGALTPLTPETKGWTPAAFPTAAVEPVKIGTAFFDWGRCLPWAMATPCIVCEEVCPTSPKAIRLEPADVLRADGRVVRVQRPVLDPDLCVGCGLCEAKCPVASPAAIRITRAGESRDPRGGFTLGSSGRKP